MRRFVEDSSSLALVPARVEDDRAMVGAWWDAEYEYDEDECYVR